MSQGQNHAHAIRRAYILLHSDAGRTDEAIAQFLFCSEDTVRRTRVRYLTNGLDAALEDKPRPGRGLLLNAQQEAYLIALACSTPPAGQERWTLELLARQMIADEQVVLPFYILHQNVLLWVGFFVVGWSVPDLAKYLIIMLPSFLATLLLYEYLVRRVTALRILFGMKSLCREKTVAKVALSMLKS